MPSTSPLHIRDLSPQEFAQLTESWHLIDVRSRFEYALGHAPTAINLSLPRLLMGQVPFLRPWVLPQWFRALPPDQPIAVICLTAHRSPIAAKTLAALGFRQIVNITGGMMAWQQSGLPSQNR
ncbi:rhodanese-like domain-containing protein [Almyronema epifaneia]|uniref:Rhodanese-like domain-containing protein n=1 Tax=Almyronema epifaneia S1 TaxID=2991925 RepID=A0ABW6IFD1_9CYAN